MAETHYVTVDPKVGWIVRTPIGCGVITELGEDQIKVGNEWFDYDDVKVEEIKKPQRLLASRRE